MLGASATARARRRQLLLLAAAELLLAAAVTALPGRYKPVHRVGQFDEDAFWAAEKRYGTFRQTYRLSPSLFCEVHDRIRLRLATDDVAQAERGCGHAISSMQRFVVALRFLAGGSVHDIRRAYGPISEAEIYRSVWMVVAALNTEYAGQWGIPVPKGEPGTPEYRDAIEQLQRLEMAHAAHSKYGRAWRGQIGSIDGCIIAQKNPGKAVPDPARYYCERKSCYALLLMAIADQHRRILWWDISFCPTTHDSTAWADTELGRQINNGDLPSPFFINGDNAFRPAQEWMATPGGTDAYDFVQSSMRMPIECAFGILIMTWGILWRPLGVMFERRAPLVSAVIILHNLRVDAGMPEPEYRKRTVEGIRTDDTGRRFTAKWEEWEVVPGEWVVPPSFDEIGRPIDRMARECFDEPVDTGQFDSAAAYNTLQTKLESSVAAADISRPSASVIRQMARGPR